MSQHLFGIPNVPKYKGTFSSMWEIIYDLEHLDQTNGYTFLLTVISIAILEFAKWWKTSRYDAVRWRCACAVTV